MKLIDFVYLAKNVTLFCDEYSKSVWTKDEVIDAIKRQIRNDIYSGVKDSEIKQRVRYFLEKFEPMPPKSVVSRRAKKIIKDLRLK